MFYLKIYVLWHTFMSLTRAIEIRFEQKDIHWKALILLVLSQEKNVRIEIVCRCESQKTVFLKPRFVPKLNLSPIPTISDM